MCNGGEARKKTRMMSTSNRQKYDAMTIRFDTIPAVTEGLTDGLTDRRTELVKQYRGLHALHADAR